MIKLSIQETKENKKNRLLDTGFKLFTEKGIQNTSIQDIVDNANVAKGTFYLYFKDKYEDILDQILTFADPTTALRGRTAMPINIDLGAPYYKLNGMNGYNRSYNSFGYHRGGY